MYVARETKEAVLLSRTRSRLKQNSEVRNRQCALSFFAVIHNLPPTPAFRDELANSPIAEIGLRVLVEFEGGETHVVGTATLIAGHLAITAKHVVDYVVRRFGARQKGANNAVVRDYAIRLYQVFSGTEALDLPTQTSVTTDAKAEDWEKFSHPTQVLMRPELRNNISP